MDERHDIPTIIGPRRCDPGIIIIRGRVFPMARGQDNSAIYFQPVQRVAAQGPVDVMKPERGDFAVLIAEGAQRRVRNVVSVTGIGPGGENCLGRSNRRYDDSRRAALIGRGLGRGRRAHDRERARNA
ncbi:hypothetical protein [Terrarubrum flagellatum]|uniref:hypothetical protein n=1 Tax=Terrirubrum flagellatum TaxID=2895980 RepID=UPI00314531A8